AVTDARGMALAGSPLDPAPSRRARRPALPPRRVPRRRPVCVVLVVQGQDDAADLRACLHSVLVACPADGRVVVIDDAAHDAALAEALDLLAAQRAIRLIRHAAPRGYSASVNRGLALAGGCDVLVAHGDTLLAPDAITRLRLLAYEAAAIGSVTPFASDAAAPRYGAPWARGPMPDEAETARLARLAWRANGAGCVDLPVGEGFCLYLRHDCLAATGRLRAAIFPEGDGAVSDFCLRAASAGWRHIAATGVFIAHRGDASRPAPARQALRAHGAAQIAALYPDHGARLAAFAAADPLAPARRALDLARWRATALPPRAPLLVLTHGDGGGVDRAVSAMLARARARGQGAIVLRPAADGAVRLDRGDGALWPDLRFAMPGEWPALRRLLRAAHPESLEIHHTLGHHPGLAARLAGLGLPYRVHVHDYALACPRIAFVDGEGRYCGEPAAAGCAACLAAYGSLSGETIAVPALRARSAGLLRGAAAVTAPSADAAARMRRHFPGIAIRAVPPERDCPPDPAAIAAARARAVPGRVCVIGAIGMHKGFDVLAACARDAAMRALHLEFIVVGHTIDDAALLETGRVFITGPYDRAEAVIRITEQNAALAFLPSIGPETWAYTLSEAWRAGLAAAVFDLGAPAARIRRHGHGLVLPLGLQARAINSALIAAMASPPLVPAALPGDE
ncbi:MAG: glycosyltransferase, partial [Rhodospirillales bacterium]|nr:glycosyltransferase [Rhodospirillales bacterium]